MGSEGEAEGRWFAGRADAIIEATWSSDYESVMLQIDSLERDANAGTTDTEEHHEYRRRIAELRLFLARKKRRPTEECEELFARRCSLGFRSTAEEAIEESAHARYCLAIGDKLRALKHARTYLENIGPDGSKVPKELDAALREVVRRAST